MSNAETKTASQMENKSEVKDLQPEMQELNVAAAEQVRGGVSESVSLNFAKTEIKY